MWIRSNRKQITSRSIYNELPKQTVLRLNKANKIILSNGELNFPHKHRITFSIFAKFPMWGGKIQSYRRILSFAIRRSAAQRNVNINNFLYFSRDNTSVLYLSSHQLSTKIVDCTTLARFKWNQMETVKKRGSISFIARSKSTWRHQTNKNLSKIKCLVPTDWRLMSPENQNGLFLLFPCVRTVTIKMPLYDWEFMVTKSWFGLCFLFMFMVGVSPSAEMGSR